MQIHNTFLHQLFLKNKHFFIWVDVLLFFNILKSQWYINPDHNLSSKNVKENIKSNNHIKLMAFLSYVDFIQYGIDCLLEYDMVRFFLIYNSYLNDIDYATGVAEYI